MPTFVSDGEFKPKTREYAKGPRGPRARKPEQVPWDKAFKSAHDAGKPLFAQVTPEEAEAARKAVASAARLYGLATTEGEPQAGAEKGTVVLSWLIRVPSKREDKPQAVRVSE